MIVAGTKSNYNQNSGYVSGEYVRVLTEEEVSEITVDRNIREYVC